MDELNVGDRVRKRDNDKYGTVISVSTVRGYVTVDWDRPPAEVWPVDLLKKVN